MGGGLGWWGGVGWGGGGHFNLGYTKSQRGYDTANSFNQAAFSQIPLSEGEQCVRSTSSAQRARPHIDRVVIVVARLEESLEGDPQVLGGQAACPSQLVVLVVIDDDQPPAVRVSVLRPHRHSADNTASGENTT